MSKQTWSEAVKTNNLEEHMLLDPLYYSFGDKEQKCWGGGGGGVQVNVGGVQTMLGGCTNEVGGCAPPAPPQKIRQCFYIELLKFIACKIFVLARIPVRQSQLNTGPDRNPGPGPNPGLNPGPGLIPVSALFSIPGPGQKSGTGLKLNVP